MDLFADNINIRIVNEETLEPIPHIAIRIRLFARHKNDYFITYISNEEGYITINKSDLRSEIIKNKNLFVMDYSSELEDCEPRIELVLLNISDIHNEIQGMQEWKHILNIQDNEIKKLEKVKNELYIPASKIIEFSGQKNKQVIFGIKLPK
jgi:hypothetical protein